MAKKMMSIVIDDKALNKQLSKALARNPRITSQKITAIALDLQGKSSRMAPVDTGDLRSNCNVDLSKAKGTKAQATVGYSLPYALRQHEDMTLNHPRDGEAKYLEKPFKQNQRKYIAMIEKIPKEVLR